MHSQGSPLHVATELEQDPAIAPIENAEEQAEDESELAGMEFSPNEEAPTATIPAKFEEQPAETVKVTEQHDFVPTETPAEVPLLSEAPTPAIDDTSVDEAPIASMAAPTAFEHMRLHVRDLQVEPEPERSTPAEEDAQGLESALDAVEKHVATINAEVSPVEESAPAEEVAQVPQLILDTHEKVTEVFAYPNTSAPMKLIGLVASQYSCE